MGIAQSLPTAYKNTYDFLVNNEGYGLPATRRLPYADYGIILAAGHHRLRHTADGLDGIVRCQPTWSGGRAVYPH